MTAERPWHAKAREMRAEGASYRTIGAACGVTHQVIARFLNEEYRKRYHRYRSDRRRQRLATDPAYREYLRAYRKRRYIIEYARAEAAETGRPVEELYAAWGVPHVR